MRTIEKKCWPEYFEEISAGRKTFEVRLNDFEIEEGDFLLLKEWNPETKDYTGRELKKKVGFIGRWNLKNPPPLWRKEEIEEKGIQVISLL
jgi:ASC-1-like (ASCH) protein